MVRAKFKVQGNNKTFDDPETPGFTIDLHPVISGSKENEEFYKWTPGGNIQLSTINEAAAKQFEMGKEFYVDFTPAE